MLYQLHGPNFYEDLPSALLFLSTVELLPMSENGGGDGIRTHETFKGLHAFQECFVDHKPRLKIKVYS